MTTARWTSALMILALLGSARADDASDSEFRWNQSILALAQVIADRGDPAAISALSAPGAWVAPFDMNRTESITVLQERLATRQIVSVRSYLHPCVTGATDIVADLSAAGTIDEKTLKRMTPDDPADLRKADATMARWFSAALDARNGDPVAVLTLYDDGKSEPAHPPQLHFILIRGEIDSDGKPLITRLLYGPMQSTLK